MEHLAQPMTMLLLFVTGLGVALLGSIKLPLARKLQIDEARVGGLVSAFGFTIIPMILLSGLLTDSVGQKAVVVGGGVLMMVGLALLGLSRSYVAALVAVLFLGTAWSALVNSVNSFVPEAFGGSTAYATNLANVFFGIGAFVTPMGLAYFLRNRSVSTVLLGLSAAIIVPIIFAGMVDFGFVAAARGAEEPATAAVEAGMIGLLANPVLWILALGMFFYAPLEASMGAWSTSYLSELGVSESRALKWLSAFWLSFMLSRLATAFLLPVGAERTLILLGAVACVAVLLALVWTRTASMGVVIVVAAGLIFGPIFPTLMALLLDNIDFALRGRAVGLFFAIGAVGWTIIPAMIGSVAKRSSIRQGFRVGVGSAFGLLIIATLILWRF